MGRLAHQGLVASRAGEAGRMQERFDPEPRRDHPQVAAYQRLQKFLAERGRGFHNAVAVVRAFFGRLLKKY